MDENLEYWYKKIWETKGNRFNASRRLEALDFWSMTTIILSSVYILFLNLLVFVDLENTYLTSNTITISTIVLSVAVLLFSTVISLKGYKMQAYLFHACALELSELYDQTVLWKNNKSAKDSDIEELRIRYNQILGKFNLNHSPLDYDMFKIKNPKYYTDNERFFIGKTYLFYFMKTSFIPCIIIISPIILYCTLS